MRIYKISQLKDPDIEKANAQLQAIIEKFKSQYKGLDLWAFEDNNRIFLNSIKVPLEMRRQGIGREIIKVLKDFAQSRGKPLVVSPEAEKGYKSKLDNWYRDQGFIDNKGRYKDYEISEPFGRTMYWRP